MKKQKEKGKRPEIHFEIFEPKSEREVQSGTVTRAKASCPGCNMVLGPARVRAQLAMQRGGADVVFDVKGQRTGGARLLAAVLLKVGDPGRHYRLPTERDYEAVREAQARLAQILENSGQGARKGLSPVPDEPLPSPPGKSEATKGAYYNFMPLRLYGYETWGDLFTARQKVALVTLMTSPTRSMEGEAASAALSLAISRCTEQSSSFVRWRTTVEAVAGTFGRQALPMMWDFAEIVVTGDLGSNFAAATEWVAEVIETWHGSRIGQFQAVDAIEHPLPDETAQLWFTDPPYYDAVPYADLSDFFFVWLKRLLPGHPLLRDSLNSANPLTPKSAEIIDSLMLLRGVPKEKALQLGLKVKDKAFYEDGMAHAFAEGRRVLRQEGVGSVVFAHKTTEGWEALLSGMVRGGWTITGSWPIATERPGRLRSQESAALATSVHLVCRPRADNAPTGDWQDVVRELPERVAEWIERLQLEHVRGADLVFACIGPALEVYSRYSRVVDAEDREIPLGGDPEAVDPYKRGYLAYVWEAVGRAALEQVLGTAEATARNGGAEALEEDARLTALFLWTLQSTNGEEKAKVKSQKEKGGEAEDDEEDEEAEEADTKAKKKKGLTLVFDVVRRFAQPLGIHLDNWEDRIIETEKGIVRLLPVGERGTQLFGQDGADLVAERLERSTATTFQLTLFPDKTEAAPKVKGKKGKAKKGTAKDLRTSQEATTLDRVHAAMLLQASGRTNGLRALLKAEQDRGPDFLRLANALSALYPKQSEEKRLLDAMLLAVPK